MSHPHPTTWPPAYRSEVPELLHGRAVADPYRWLEDADSARTAAWLAAQHELFARARPDWSAGPALRRLLDDLTRFDLLSAPRWAGGRAFGTRRGGDAEHPVLQVVEPDGRPRVLVDPQRIDPSGATTLGSWAASPDGTLLSYQLAADGAERFTLYVLDVATGEQVDEPVPGCRYSDVAWLPGQRAFYHVRHTDPADDEAGQQVYLHRVGEPAQRDVAVFGAGWDPTAEFDVAVDVAGRRLVVTAGLGLAAENTVWVADLRAGDPAAPRLVEVAALRDGWSAAWPARDGRIYLLTTVDADRGRLAVLEPDGGAPAGHSTEPTTAGAGPVVRTLVGEDPEAVLTSFAVLDGPLLAQPQILALYDHHGRSTLRRHDLATGAPLGPVPLPGAGGGTVAELTFRPDGGHEAWLVCSDRRTPETVYRFDARTGECRPWQAQQPVPVPAVDVEEVEYRSTDGTPVRLLLLGPAGKAARALPTVLQGYGAFGEPQVADYYAAALAWVALGGRFAVACVRGGGEHGESWHAAGAGPHKLQGIDDLIAAGEYLVASGRTPRGGLAAFGHSAGGLLVAAALTRRPDVFAAAVCAAPLTDMVRYERWGLGPYWAEEFGSAAVPEQLDWLLRYSPYHRVRPGTPYPATLVCAFAEDSRVDPAHARKFVAALQAATTGGPVLLRHEAGVGHGERARSGRLDFFADVLAFCHHVVAGPVQAPAVQDVGIA